jgi:hypothetical protein
MPSGGFDQGVADGHRHRSAVGGELFECKVRIVVREEGDRCCHELECPPVCKMIDW